MTEFVWQMLARRFSWSMKGAKNPHIDIERRDCWWEDLPGSYTTYEEAHLAAKAYVQNWLRMVREDIGYRNTRGIMWTDIFVRLRQTVNIDAYVIKFVDMDFNTGLGKITFTGNVILPYGHIVTAQAEAEIFRRVIEVDGAPKEVFWMTYFKPGQTRPINRRSRDIHWYYSLTEWVHKAAIRNFEQYTRHLGKNYLLDDFQELDHVFPKVRLTETYSEPCKPTLPTMRRLAKYFSCPNTTIPDLRSHRW